MVMKLDVPSKVISSILNDIDLYNTHVLARRTKVTRHYETNFYGEIVQLDVGFMANDRGYRYFLIAQGEWCSFSSFWAASNKMARQIFFRLRFGAFLYLG